MSVVTFQVMAVRRDEGTAHRSLLNANRHCTPRRVHHDRPAAALAVTPTRVGRSLTFRLQYRYERALGIMTLPTIFMRFLPFFCFSRSLRLREMSPP